MLYVLALPVFAPDALGVIEQFRAHYEPRRAQLIAPHFTLVFGTSALDETMAGELTRQVAKTASSFRVVLTERKIVHDSFDNTKKLFLLPSIGGQELTELHDAFYARLPAGELRTDIPYEPHLTIASCSDLTAANAAMDASEGIALPITAKIEALAVVGMAQAVLRTIGRYTLG